MEDAWGASWPSETSSWLCSSDHLDIQLRQQRLALQQSFLVKMLNSYQSGPTVDGIPSSVQKETLVVLPRQNLGICL